MKYIPLGCQTDSSKFVVKNKWAGLFVRMGIGKTISILTVVEKLMYDVPKLKRVLIVAPLRVSRFTWPEEIEKWEHTKILSYVFLHGAHKDKLINQCKGKDITIDMATA
jgi:SNF2 family DNA or RNA helicase